MVLPAGIEPTTFGFEARRSSNWAMGASKNAISSYNMVRPTGFEPVASAFAGLRSNPTELWARICFFQALLL